MPTPRSEAIIKSHQNGDFPIAPASEETYAANKIDHYAALGRIMDQAIEQLFADGEGVSGIKQSVTPRELRLGLLGAVHDSIVRAMADHPAIHHHLEESQRERNNIRPEYWRDFNMTLLAGSQTFANTVEAVYTTVTTLYDHQAAIQPNTYKILYRLALLPVNHSVFYRNVFLEDPLNSEVAMSHFMQANDGSVTFRPHMPDTATVPLEVAKMWAVNYGYKIDIPANQGSLALLDIPLEPYPDDAQIGCPITFRPDNLKKLWGLYTETRGLITARESLGQKAVATLDGTAASDPEMP